MAATPIAPVTVTVARIAAVLAAAGLAPRTSAKSYRGSLELYFTGPRPESAFGVVHIGARSGRVLRAFVQLGNDGEKLRFTDGRMFLRTARLLPGAVVRYHGSLTRHHGHYLVTQHITRGPTAGRIRLVGLDRDRHELIATGPASMTPMGRFVALSAAAAAAGCVTPGSGVVADSALAPIARALADAASSSTAAEELQPERRRLLGSVHDGVIAAEAHTPRTR